MFNANSQKDIEVEIIFNKLKKLKKTEIVKLRVSKNLKNEKIELEAKNNAWVIWGGGVK